jgi:hypothetical protein
MKTAFLFAVACHCLLAAIAQENAPFGASDASVLGTNSADGPLVLTRVIPLPGVIGGLNHMSATQKELFVAVPEMDNQSAQIQVYTVR